MSAQPDVTVLICTWNRCDDLRSALASLNDQTLSPDRFEVLVVDNNSTDATAEAVRQAASEAGYRLRYIMEKAQGKSRALNTGIAAAGAPVVACTDDDCRPEPDWLEEILRAFEDPDVGILGGPGISVYPEPVKSDSYRLFLAQRFLGDFAPYDRSIELLEKDPPLGLNLSFRREIAEQAGGFDVNLGPTGPMHFCREETAFVRNAQARGYRVFYNPRAIVRHHIQEERITWNAIQKQAFDSGIGTYRERYASRASRSLFDRIVLTLHFSAELLYSGARVALYSLNAQRRTVACFRAAAAAGKMAGLWSERG